jgi:hypothetical protein
MHVYKTTEISTGRRSEPGARVSVGFFSVTHSVYSILSRAVCDARGCTKAFGPTLTPGPLFLARELALGW